MGFSLSLTRVEAGRFNETDSWRDECELMGNTCTLYVNLLVCVQPTYQCTCKYLRNSQAYQRCGVGVVNVPLSLDLCTGTKITITQSPLMLSSWRTDLPASYRVQLCERRSGGHRLQGWRIAELHLQTRFPAGWSPAGHLWSRRPLAP